MRRLLVTIAPFLPFERDATDKTLCDLDRVYQGGVGILDDDAYQARVTVALRRSGNAVAGSIYDERGASKVDVTSGKAEADGTFHFVESRGGEYVGRCGDAGKMEGTYTLAGKEQSFRLFSRPKNWPLLIVTTRESKKSSTCSAKDTGVRYVGASPQLNLLVNHHLEGDAFKENVVSLADCGERVLQTDSELQFANPDVVTVQRSSSSYFGGAHPFNSTYDPFSISLRTGKVIQLADVVTDLQKLRDLLPQCMVDYRGASSLEASGSVACALDETNPCELSPGIIWGCTDKGASEPSWAIVEGGIAIVMSEHPYATDLPGHGPVVSWAALKREDLLPKHSSAAHLWKGVSAAPAEAPACTGARQPWRFVGSKHTPRTLHWTVQE